MPTNKEKSLAAESLELHRILGWMDLVIGSIDDAVCVVDKTGNIIFSNNYFADLLATPRIFLLGQSFNEVFPVVQTDTPLTEYLDFKNKLGNVSKGDENICEWIDKEKNHLFFRVSGRLLPSSEQVVYLIHDITSEYELSLMKNSFINLASHQLRTPMTAIMTYSNMLKDGYGGELNEAQQKLADILVDSSERMIALVEDLLRITRLQNTSFIQKSDISIRQIFEKIQTELKPRLIEKKLQYTFVMDDNIPPIHTDQSMLHEIFSNLIVNAIQYTSINGSIKITIKLKAEKIVISISDTGIGIPKEHQPHIFEQFARADNAMQEFNAGTGLGLYVVKLLLEKIDGTISCKSKLNVGTTFIISMPLS